MIATDGGGPISEARAAPLSGVLFALLLVAGFAVDPTIEFMPTEDEAIRQLSQRPTHTMVAAYLGLLAAGALIWFAGSVHDRTRRIDERLAVTALGGGLVGAAMLIMGEVATISAAERLVTNRSIDPGAAAALVDISGVAIGNGMPIGMAVMIAAVSLCSLQAGPNRAIGALGLVIALGLLTPFGWAVLPVAVIIWIPAVGIDIFRSPKPASVGT